MTRLLICLMSVMLLRTSYAQEPVYFPTQTIELDDSYAIFDFYYDKPSQTLATVNLLGVVSYWDLVKGQKIKTVDLRSKTSKNFGGADVRFYNLNKIFIPTNLGQIYNVGSDHITQTSSFVPELSFFAEETKELFNLYADHKGLYSLQKVNSFGVTTNYSFPNTVFIRGPFNKVSGSRDGESIAFFNSDSGRIQFWNTQSETLVLEFDHGDSQINHCDFLYLSNDVVLFSITSSSRYGLRDNNEVYYANLKTKKITIWSKSKVGYLGAESFSSSKKLVALSYYLPSRLNPSGESLNEIRILDKNTKTLKYKLKSEISGQNLFSPKFIDDKKVMAFESNPYAGWRKILIWDLSKE